MYNIVCFLHEMLSVFDMKYCPFFPRQKEKAGKRRKERKNKINTILKLNKKIT